MGFKFEQPDVWRLSLDYADRIYELPGKSPRDEEFNLKSPIRRTATSVSLNIAEGSAGLADAEPARFLSIALCSLIEPVACLDLIHRRGYLPDRMVLRQV